MACLRFAFSTSLLVFVFSWITHASAEMPFQHLTTSDASSVSTDAYGVVGAWGDQSGNARNASATVGSVIFPSANGFPSGLAGLQFGPTADALQLLSAPDTARLLDFNGAASASTGFSILLSVRIDQLSSTTEPSDVLGVTTVNTAGGLGLRFNSAGLIVAYLGGVVLQRPAADRKVVVGDSVVFALNYDAASGRFSLWDSLNESEVGATIPKGNFAGIGLPLLLGSLGNSGRFLIGAVGEVRLYGGALSVADFISVRTQMKDRWIRRPYQSLDATVTESVMGNPVTRWSDLSGNGRSAGAGTGGVTYPAVNRFASGSFGVQFGPPAKSLQLLDGATTAALLDFNGAAASRTGFSILLSVRLDGLVPGNEPNDILGVTSVNTAGGLGLRLNAAGQIVAYMGGLVVSRPSSDRKVVPGNSVVIALNYDAASGVLTLWDSLNETEITATRSKGNFAGSGLPLALGSMGNASRYLIGSVGEVKLFGANLPASEFAAQREALSAKWLGVRPTLPTMPKKPVFTVAQLLAWNPTADPDTPFNVATVPLKPRVNVPASLKANANARAGQGGIQALDTYAGERPQGGSGSVYTFTYWQYLEESVYWGGISAINIVPPTAEMIDNAHRNGVPILGTIFFPPLVYGGNYDWVRSFLTKVGSTYPAADKLIEMAEYFGFDGWFINQETEGGTAADAAAMRDLIRYIRQNSSLRITWYDSMTESGTIFWQDHLNASNDWYLRHNYTTGQQNNSGAPIAHSMFVDFSNDASTTLTTWTRDYAQWLGVDPYKIWTGIEAEGEDFRTSTAARVKLAKIFPDGQNHLTSAGLYKPLRFASQISDQDLFWTGASGDPRNTAGVVGTGAWRGIAHNIAERSVITTLPFATDFNIGRGSNYYNDGAIVRPGAWWNRALQAILPTWRWIIDSSGAKLTPELWDGDAFRGGGCLRISGNLNATNTLRLYLTDLPASANTRLKIVFKRPGLSGVDSLMQVGVSTAAAPASFTFYPAGSCTIDGWNQAVIDLGAHAGSRISAIALRFASGTAVSAYEIRVGLMALYDATAPAPEPPSNIQALDVVGWNGIASGRVRWDHAPGERHGYHVFLRLTDGSLVFAGATVSNHFYFENIPIAGDYASVVVKTLGADATESRLSDAPPVAPSYQSWASERGLSDPSGSGDPDGDGSVNLMEYALGTDPLSAEGPVASVSGMVVTYEKGAEAIANGDVSWTIESSQTLAAGSWTTQVFHAAGDPRATIVHGLSPSGSGRDFVRLRVALEP